MSDELKGIISASKAAPFEPELGRILQPARFFRHPRDVVRDLNLTTAEKRAILSSWASDACAIESIPALRQLPGSGCIVRFDEVMDALQELDGGTDNTGSKDAPERRRDRERGGNHNEGPNGTNNW